MKILPRFGKRPDPDDDSFKRFIDNHHSRLWRVSLSLAGGDAEKAKDGLQNALAATHSRWPAINNDAKAFAFTNTVMRNWYRDDWRRAARRPAEISLEALESVDFRDQVGLTESAIVDKITLKQVLATLTLRERQVVHLHYYADLTFRHTAEILGISEGNAKRCHFEAMAKLRGQLVGTEEEVGK